MITEEQDKKWEEIANKIFNNFNEIKDVYPDFAERAACLTEIIMPIYDYLLKVGGYENFQKCYQLYLAAVKEQDGDLNS
jgi:hypothetical protein